MAGASAGGNLAAVVARRAAHAGGPQIALQVLIYPVTDCDLSALSYTDPDNQLLLTAESMEWFWDHYAPEVAARAHPDASPLRAPVLLGLPPAIVITAEHDVLRDEGELYATQLMKAQVPVRFRRFDGQMHGFFTMVGGAARKRPGHRLLRRWCHLAAWHPGGPRLVVTSSIRRRAPANPAAGRT